MYCPLDYVPSDCEAVGRKLDPKINRIVRWNLSTAAKCSHSECTTPRSDPCPPLPYDRRRLSALSRRIVVRPGNARELAFRFYDFSLSLYSTNAANAIAKSFRGPRYKLRETKNRGDFFPFIFLFFLFRFIPRPPFASTLFFDGQSLGTTSRSTTTTAKTKR